MPIDLNRIDRIHSRLERLKRKRDDLLFPPSVAELIQLDCEIERLEQELAKLHDRAKDSLGSRERATLLKLVIGMAVEGYDYVPGAARNDAVAEIAADLEKVGVAVSADTVRDYLKEAVELVLPKRK
jgi:hypothetical protein